MALSDLQRLVFAAGTGNSEEVKLLINGGVNPDGPEDNSGAPLFAALAGRHNDVVRILLETGANVAVTDRFGDGQLEYALHYNDDKSVYELLGYNAKLRVHTKNTYQLLLEHALTRR